VIIDPKLCSLKKKEDFSLKFRAGRKASIYRNPLAKQASTFIFIVKHVILGGGFALIAMFL
jgi:hypothetical protein